MFLVTCEIVGRTGLVWPSDLVSIANTDAGIVVRYRCLCGDEAAMLTGAGLRPHAPSISGRRPESVGHSPGL